MLFRSGFGANHNINSLGGPDNNWVSSSHGIRPVINLKANVTLTGTGTKDNPYIVEGAE